MRHLRTVGAMALVAAALSAFAASASATTITSPTGTQYDGKVTARSEGHIVIHGSFGVKVECTKHWSGKITQNGAHPTPTTPAIIQLETFSFFECTNEYEAHVLNNASGNKGTLSVTGTGEIRGTGQTINITTPLGITCEYTTNNTKIGTITDSHETGGTATIHTTGSLPRTGGSFLCGSTGTWTGSDWFEATEGPSHLIYID